MPFPWKPNIGLIADGEQVSANVANRPLNDLAQQTQSLKSELSDLQQGAGRLVYAQVPLAPDVGRLDFVYFDRNQRAFSQALAEATADARGLYVAGERSYVVGMVLNKNPGEAVGDILLCGRLDVDADQLDLNSMLDLGEAFEDGRFFLSSRSPGKMTRFVREPNVQLGFFSRTLSHVQPIQKDIFESHSHFSFPLFARPCASQNRARTGFSDMGVTNGARRVDHYDTGADAIPPPIVLCLRANGLPPTDPGSPVRIELYNASGQLGIAPYSGAGLDYFTAFDSGPLGVAQTATFVPWPDYGQWVAIPNTNLEVAFVNVAGSTSSLATDAASLLTTTDKRWKVWLPNDLVGWTNANPHDLATPANAVYRYLSESDPQLNAAFPPVPAESAAILQNGVQLAAGQDFAVNPYGIFWMAGGSANGVLYAPWPSDYNTSGGGMSADYARTLELCFSRSSLANANSVVFSLVASSPLTVVRCPDGAPGSTGNLRVGIDLAMAVDPEVGASDVALTSVQGQTFSQGTVVSELVAGAGIQITRLSTQRQANVGRLQVSRSDMKFEGDISSVALRNAKETWIGSLLPIIEFLQPATAACGITASFKLPNADFVPGFQVSLKVAGQWLGSAGVAADGVSQIALLRVVWHVVRPGADLSALNDLSSLTPSAQYWQVPFAPGYRAQQSLSSEYPGDGPTLVISPSTITAPASPAYLVGLLPGDIITLQIDRVSQQPGSSNFDTYAGRLGMAGLRWMIL